MSSSSIPLVVTLGKDYVVGASTVYIVTRFIKEGWHEHFEFVNRESQMRTFYTPEELEYLFKTKSIRLATKEETRFGVNK